MGTHSYVLQYPSGYDVMALSASCAANRQHIRNALYLHEGVEALLAQAIDHEIVTNLHTGAHTTHMMDSMIVTQAGVLWSISSKRYEAWKT